MESAEYQELRDLRFAELRRPLGLEWTVAEGEADKLDRHFGFFQDEILVGTVVVASLSPELAKLRQIAVATTVQGEGLGRCLMEAIESLIALERVEGLELHARLEVAGFYDALGYQRRGEIFDEIGLPHVKMVKSLRESAST